MAVIGLNWNNCDMQYRGDISRILNFHQPSSDDLAEEKDNMCYWFVTTPHEPIEKQLIFLVFDALSQCGFGLRVATLSGAFGAWAHNSDINVVDGVLTVVQRCDGSAQIDQVNLSDIVSIEVSRVATWTSKHSNDQK